jgi:hypothetical protein
MDPVAARPPETIAYGASGPTAIEGRMILIQQVYASADPRRQRELDEARDRNRAADVFNAFENVDGTTRRASFGDLFRLAAERFAGRVCVIANSDIACDASLRLAEPLVAGRRPVLVALTRWDDASGPSMEGRVDATDWRFYSHSQDTWVFVAGRLPPFPADFLLGIPGCESRLAFEAAAAGVTVVDPALSIRTWHIHASGTRSWTRRDAYGGPVLFPRLTTSDDASGAALVRERRWWGSRETAVASTGDAAAFAARRAGDPPASLERIRLRSPFYLKKRS